jgi:hypothetical protein
MSNLVFSSIIAAALIAFGALFWAIQIWTTHAQNNLDPEEFQLWFQKHYLGLSHPTILEGHSSRKSMPGRQEAKASAQKR